MYPFWCCCKKAIRGSLIHDYYDYLVEVSYSPLEGKIPRVLYVDGVPHPEYDSIDDQIYFPDALHFFVLHSLPRFHSSPDNGKDFDTWSYIMDSLAYSPIVVSACGCDA